MKKRGKKPYIIAESEKEKIINSFKDKYIIDGKLEPLEVIREDKKLYYLIRKSGSMKKFCENIGLSLCYNKGFRAKHSKSEISKEIKKYVQECKNNGRTLTQYELMKTRSKLFYFIKRRYKDFTTFSRENGLDGLLKHKSRKMDNEKRKNEYARELLKKTVAVGAKDIITFKNRSEINLPYFVKVKEFFGELERNFNVIRVPKDVFTFLISLKKVKTSEELIDEINKATENASMKQWLYKRYKNNVVQRLIEDFGLQK